MESTVTEVVAALIWDRDRFLACQRPAHKARGLLWEFVGGKVEPGETKQEALVRECREELAITVSVGEVFMALTHAYPDLTVHLTLFNAEIREGTPTLLEHNEIRWITTEQIDAYPFCPADAEILGKLKTARNYLQARLFAMQDPDYKAFNAKAIPTVPPDTMLGIRMPELRKFAKSLDQKTAAWFLRELPHRFYEENNLHGMLISEIKDFDEAVEALDAFLPYVDNWATCDLLAPKAFRSHPAALPAKIREWLLSDHLYTVRFGIGTLLKFYLGEAFSPEYLDWVAAIRSEEYYLNMMIAWYFATALAKQYPAAIAYLENHRLSPWTHRKTIQKAVESYRISDERKTYLRSLKR